MGMAIALLSGALAVVLAASALGKLRSPGRGAEAFAALRLPTRHAVVGIVALSVAELGLAVALVVARGSVLLVAASSSVVLFGGFLVVVMRAHLLGSTDPCGCFGEGEGSRIGSWLIARNSLLVAVAVALVGLLLLSPPVGVTGVLQTSDGAVVLAAGALVGALAYFTAPHSGGVVATADAGAPSDAALLFVGSDEAGVVDVRARAYRRAQLLVWVRAGCGSCVEVIDVLNRHAADLSATVSVSVITTDRDQSTVDALGELARPHAHLVDVGARTADTIGIARVRPSAALVGTDGAVIQPLAAGRDEVRELISVLCAAAATEPDLGHE